MPLPLSIRKTDPKIISFKNAFSAFRGDTLCLLPILCALRLLTTLPARNIYYKTARLCAAYWKADTCRR